MARIPLIILAAGLCLSGGLHLGARETVADAGSHCAVLTKDVHAGDQLYRELTTQTPCQAGEASVPLIFDYRTKAPVVTASLPSGTYLGPIALKPGKIFTNRDVLQLRFNQGPVAIERRVSPLVPVRAGQTAVVRSEGGTIFTAQLVLEQAQ